MKIKFFKTQTNCLDGYWTLKFVISKAGAIFFLVFPDSLFRNVFLLKFNLDQYRVSLQIQRFSYIRDQKEMFISKVKDYEQIAKKKLPPEVFNYFFSGSDDEITLKNNVAAFNAIKLYPRVLRDMRQVSLKTKILGKQVDLPFGIAPFAMQKLLHPQGQLVSAKVAKQRNTAYGLSMMSTTKISQLTGSQYNPDGIKVMQLYFLKKASYTQKIIRFVQEHGFTALAITVDTQAFGKRRLDDKNKFSPNVTLQVFNDMGVPLYFRSQNKEESFIHSIDNEISWKFIEEIKKKTKLKIILKGLIHPDDAQTAYKYGVDAVWISNHGGRQLDSSPATIWALPAIKERISKLEKEFKRKVEIYVDGGIWKGSDIFKCLALGADFVFIGRAFLYSLVEGEKGLNNCFDMLTHELKNTMILCGTHSISEIDESYIFNPPSKL